jgi:hypothetical protein
VGAGEAGAAKGSDPLDLLDFPMIECHCMSPFVRRPEAASTPMPIRQIAAAQRWQFNLLRNTVSSFQPLHYSHDLIESYAD